MKEIITDIKEETPVDISTNIIIESNISGGTTIIGIKNQDD